MAATAALRPHETRESGAPAFPPPPVTARPIDRAAWIAAFRQVRSETERRAAPLSPEDQQVQSMADASPTKWHRAHVTWFFEQFLLRAAPAGLRHLRRAAPLPVQLVLRGGRRRGSRAPQRGMITRPTMAEVTAYRAHVDRAVEALLGQASETRPSRRVADPGDRALPRAAAPGTPAHRHPARLRAEPAEPRLRSGLALPAAASAQSGQVRLDRRIAWIGHAGEGFSFDNESPRHEALIPAGRIDRALVTNRPVARLHGGWWLRRRRSCGSRTAGTPARRRAGRRPATGGATGRRGRP